MPVLSFASVSVRTTSTPTPTPTLTRIIDPLVGLGHVVRWNKLAVVATLSVSIKADEEETSFAADHSNTRKWMAHPLRDHHNFPHHHHLHYHHHQHSNHDPRSVSS